MSVERRGREGLMIVIHRRERKERRDSMFKLLKDGIRHLVNELEE